jgi:hypothetical protein
MATAAEQPAVAGRGCWAKADDRCWSCIAQASGRIGSYQCFVFAKKKISMLLRGKRNSNIDSSYILNQAHICIFLLSNSNVVNTIMH